MTFKEKFRQTLDVEVAKVHEQHPHWGARLIAQQVIASYWDVRCSLKRLGIKIPLGHPIVNSEN
jgi:hypothetical protein